MDLDANDLKYIIKTLRGLFERLNLTYIFQMIEIDLANSDYAKELPPIQYALNFISLLRNNLELTDSSHYLSALRNLNESLGTDSTIESVEIVFNNSEVDLNENLNLEAYRKIKIEDELFDNRELTNELMQIEKALRGDAWQ